MFNRSWGLNYNVLKPYVIVINLLNVQVKEIVQKWTVYGEYTIRLIIEDPVMLCELNQNFCIDLNRELA